MIKEIVENIINTYYPLATFEVADNLQADVDSLYLETINFPFVLFDTISFTYEKNRFNEQIVSTSILITFLQLDSYDNHSAQTFDIIESMKEMALDVCYKISNNSLFIGDNSFNFQKIVHDLSADLSGIAVTVDLQYRTNQICN